MDIGIISVRYAKALLRYATEEKCEGRIYREMKMLAQAYVDVPQLQSTLMNPVLEFIKKKQLLIIAVGINMSVTLERFIHIILINVRLDMLLFITRSYIRLYQQQKKLITGQLTLPASLSSEMMQRLCGLVEKHAGSSVEFSTRIDPSLGGGFIIEYDTYRLDASLQTQLSQLKQQLC